MFAFQLLFIGKSCFVFFSGRDERTLTRELDKGSKIKNFKIYFLELLFCKISNAFSKFKNLKFSIPFRDRKCFTLFDRKSSKWKLLSRASVFDHASRQNFAENADFPRKKRKKHFYVRGKNVKQYDHIFYAIKHLLNNFYSTLHKNKVHYAYGIVTRVFIRFFSINTFPQNAFQRTTESPWMWKKSI